MNKLTLNKIQLHSTDMIQAILFKYCILTSNETTHNRIKKILKEYLNEINEGIYKKGWIMREKILELLDKFFQNQVSRYKLLDSIQKEI